MVAKLVLQTERLVSSSGYVGFTLQFTPTVIISEPNQVTFAIGHLSWDTEVAVEVVGLLAVFAVFVNPIVYLCQGVVGVDPSLFRAVFFEDFGFNQVVMQIVEVVLHFAVGIRLFSKANFFDQFIN